MLTYAPPVQQKREQERKVHTIQNHTRLMQKSTLPRWGLTCQLFRRQSAVMIAVMFEVPFSAMH